MKRLGPFVIVLAAGLADAGPSPPPRVPRLAFAVAQTCVASHDCALLGDNLDLPDQVLETLAGKKLRAIGVDARSGHVMLASFAPDLAGSVKVGVYQADKLISNQITVTVVAAGSGSDADGDGVKARSDGGNDCDDGDVSRYPGNAEIIDAHGHDEDCDPTTVGNGNDVKGSGDVDRDGEIDARVCNVMLDSAHVVTWMCGVDCDDGNPAITIGAQICDPSDAGSVLICRPPHPDVAGVPYDAGKLGVYDALPFTGLAPWERHACPSGSTCIAQPNGTGVCR